MYICVYRWKMLMIEQTRPVRVRIREKERDEAITTKQRDQFALSIVVVCTRMYMFSKLDFYISNYLYLTSLKK